jgi:hypothetical protein
MPPKKRKHDDDDSEEEDTMEDMWGGQDVGETMCL